MRVRWDILIGISSILLALSLFLLTHPPPQTPSSSQEEVIYTLPPLLAGRVNMSSPLILHTVWENGTPAQAVVILGGMTCNTTLNGLCTLSPPPGVYTVLALAPGSRLGMTNFTLRERAEVTLTLHPARRITCEGVYEKRIIAPGTRSEAREAIIQCDQEELLVYDPFTLHAFWQLENESRVRIEGWLAAGKHGWWGFKQGVYPFRIMRVSS